MEEAPSTLPKEEILCGSCNTQVSDTDAFCDNCGYPVKGTEEEQRFFLSERSAKEIDLIEYNSQIKKAGNTLYIIAGLWAVWGLIFYVQSHDTAELVADLVLIVLFAGLGLWSRRKPLTAIISGAALYAIVLILLAVVNPISIISGILWKIMIIGAFIRGIKAAIEVEKVKKELNIK